MNRQDEWAEQLVEATLMKMGEAVPAAEPDAGWEARLLQRLRSELTPDKNHPWRLWFTAGGLVTALGLLVWFAVPARPGSPPLPSVAPGMARLAPSAQPVVPPAVRTVALPQHPVSMHHRRAFSTVFPTPSPLTKQERLLLQLVADAPPAELEQIAKDTQSRFEDSSMSSRSLR